MEGSGMLRVKVDQLTKKTVRVSVMGDEGFAARAELLDKLQDLFGQDNVQRNHRSFTATYLNAETAEKIAKTIRSLWAGELVRLVGEGESHIKRMLWDAVRAFRAEFPNTVRINKISPVQVVIENVRRTALMTQYDDIVVQGEYTLKEDDHHFVGEFIDGAWSWHLDVTGRTA
jgi:hypothetical protein